MGGLLPGGWYALTLSSHDEESDSRGPAVLLSTLGGRTWALPETSAQPSLSSASISDSTTSLSWALKASASVARQGVKKAAGQGGEVEGACGVRLGHVDSCHAVMQTSLPCH